MTQSIIYTGQPMIGTAADDHIIAYAGSTGTNANTINAGGGDDWVLGDSSDTWIPNASYLNGSIATAFNFETITSTWTIDENPLFGNPFTPHTTAIVEATIGESEYFRVNIGAGQTIEIDIDFASGTALGTSRDLVVELLDAGGNILATADDSLITQGGFGSFPSSPGSQNAYDPFLAYTPVAGGTYYINVRPFGGGPGSTFTENNTFLLNLSVTGHAVGVASVMGTDTIHGDDGDDYLFGQGAVDIIYGDAGNDFIHGGSGYDTLLGGQGDDVIYGGEGTEEEVRGGEGNDTLWSGGEGHYYGEGGDDLVYAGLTSGVNEVLDGGTGVDTIDTTSWAGTYEINLFTGVTNFGESFTSFENAVTGAGADNVFGTAGANIIRTQGGIDIVAGGAGNDVIAGGADGDTLDGGGDIDILDYRTSSGAVTVNLIASTATGGDATGDTISGFEGVWGSNLGDILTGDGQANELMGNAGTDTLNGGGGNDILNGGLGADNMTGGLGDDTYFVDNVSDIFAEILGEGTDTIAAAFNFSLAAYAAFENLRAIDVDAAGPLNLTGNALANRITGNAGANQLIGGDGADVLEGGLGADLLLGQMGNDILWGGTGAANTLQGGVGDDRYVLEAGDTVVEFDGEGVDTVEARIASYTLGNHLEHLVFSGVGSFTGTGNAFNNVMIGGGSGDVLKGGLGSDTLVGQGGSDTLWGGTGLSNTLQGGLGDDTYVVEANDSIVEVAGQGTDTVDARIAVYIMGANVENMIFGGAGGFTGTGNAGANSITGGGGADVLRGRGGVDVLNGGAGFDTADYSQAAAGVTARLDTGKATNDGEGATDTLIGFEALAGSLHNDLLIGNGSANTLFGSLGADTLLGFGGNDILQGGQGAANQLQGGAGDDTYVLDAYDTVVELVGEGHDVVEAHVGTHTLATNVEDMFYVGVNKFVGVGNGGANSITGGSANDILKGMGGSDRLFGGGGADEVQFRGSQAQYAVAAEGAGYRIVDTIAGRDGSTYVESIELLRFMTGNTTRALSYPPASPVLSEKVAADAFVLPALSDDQPPVLPALGAAKAPAPFEVLPALDDRLFLGLEAQLTHLPFAGELIVDQEGLVHARGDDWLF